MGLPGPGSAPGPVTVGGGGLWAVGEGNDDNLKA